jgi:hypothetical protein
MSCQWDALLHTQPSTGQLRCRICWQWHAACGMLECGLLCGAMIEKQLVCTYWQPCLAACSVASCANTQPRLHAHLVQQESCILCPG